MEHAPSRVREIAWKAQSRLSARYRILVGRGKRTTVVCTAIARDRRDKLAPLAHGRRRDNGRGTSVTALLPASTDARSKIGTAPDAQSGMRQPTRASELDHRRP